MKHLKKNKTVTEVKLQDQKQETVKETYASGTASPAAKKILAEKNIVPSMVKGTGKDGRITKDDAVKATPSMGTKGNRLTETSRKIINVTT
jgi:2-oxoglutarate dehydrogenase E2 component (dihydrolipoamide succinyltransferase)